MPVSDQKKSVAAAITKFLSSSLSDGTVSEEDKDSVEVALECISEVFDVKSAPATIDENLEDLVANALNNKKRQPTSDQIVSPEDKQEAEKAKAEGNKYMGQQKFDLAVEAYTKAIELDPTNAIYYSNRAAAYSSYSKYEEAIADARQGITVDPTYAKNYSRLGLALYATGDARGALDAYEKGIKAEGDNPSDAMKRHYETVKKRVQEELEATTDAQTQATNSSDLQAAAKDDPEHETVENARSSPAGGSGGMPDLSSLMNNPQIAEMAKSFMSNPSMSKLMQDSNVQNLAQKFQKGEGLPNLGDLMSNPALREMAGSFMSSMAGAKKPN